MDLPKILLLSIDVPYPVFPVKRLTELADLGEIGAVAPSHYSYMGYTLRSERLLRESLPGIVRQLREEYVDVVVLIPV
jgi:D-proline reductase (dithiol) PrdB